MVIFEHFFVYLVCFCQVILLFQFAGNQGYNNNGGSHGGGGYQGGGRGRGRGGRGGGRGRYNQDQSHTTPQIATDMDTPSYSICSFGVKGTVLR